MMSPSTIRSLNEEAAERAAQEGLTPYVFFDTVEVDRAASRSRFPFPYIGDHEPEGWTEVERHFVDSSGFGADDEPALSVRQFTRVLRDAIDEAKGKHLVGWAIVSAGQFQVYVGQFHKEARA